MTTQIRPALILLVLISLLTGVIYPLAMTAIAQIIFPAQANGSLIIENNKVIGSKLISQPFDDPKYFWSRPSAAGYNAAASSGSNYGPLNPTLMDVVRKRIEALRTADPTNNSEIPVDLVTASASGLDPDISVDAAFYQAARVARARDLDKNKVMALINQNIEYSQLFILGEPRVNVLELNLTLDQIK